MQTIAGMSPSNTDQPFIAVLVTWSVLTGFVVALVLLAVLPEIPLVSLSPSPVVVVLLGGFILGGLYLTWRSARPVLVLIGLLFVVWASMNLSTACPAVGCVLPEGYQHWRHIRGFLQWGIFGPELAVTARPVTCGSPCPYVVRLLPLGLGYLLIGAGIQTKWNPL